MRARAVKTRIGPLIVVLGAGLWFALELCLAQAPNCTRDDFATVVEQSAGALRKMNAENTPKFQSKLRALKEKRQWTHEQFLKQAAPFVQDDKILAFDSETNALLNKIESLGQGGDEAKPDCGVLEDLRGHMVSLVRTTQAKWAYMNTKIDQGLWAPN